MASAWVKLLPKAPWRIPKEPDTARIYITLVDTFYDDFKDFYSVYKKMTSHWTTTGQLKCVLAYQW